MKNNILFTLIILSSFGSLAQKEITWDDLAKVTFVDKYFPEYEQSFLFPNFSSSVKALKGKEISITGYFLNIDPQSKLFILSKGPMASCYFCGIGGPETAIEVHFSTTPTFNTDDIVTITGVLELNSIDVEHFNYILKESKGVVVN